MKKNNSASNSRDLNDDYNGYGGSDFLLYQVKPRLSGKRVFIKIKKEHKNKRPVIEELLRPQQEEGMGIIEYITSDMFYFYETNDLDTSFDYIGLVSLNDDPSAPEDEDEDSFPTDGDYCVYHNYGSIHEAIRSIALYLEDCRFYICSLNNSGIDHQWIDEYVIADGKLSYRQDESEDFVDVNYFKKIARIKKDKDLQQLVLFLLEEEIKQTVSDHDEDSSDDIEAEIADYLKQAKKTDPGNKTPLYYQGLLYKNKHDYKKAHACLDKCAGTSKEGDAKLAKAIMYVTQNMYDDATRCLTGLKTIQAHHRKKLIQLLSAYSYWRTGQTDAANTHWANYTKLIFKWAYSEKITAEFYEEIFYTGQYAPIINEWISFLQREGSALLKDEENEKLLAHELLGWAGFFRQCHHEGDKPVTQKELCFRLCIQCLDVAGSYKSPYTADIPFGKGELWSKTDPQEAIRCYQAALSIQPEHIPSLQQLGEHAFSLQDYDTAIFCREKYKTLTKEKHGYDISREELSQLSECYLQKANQLINAHQYEDAARFIKLYLSIAQPGFIITDDPEATWIAMSEMHMYRSSHMVGYSKADKQAARKEELEKALYYAEIAVKVNDQSVKAWSGRGMCLNNLGRYDEALDCYDKGFQLDANYYYLCYAKACTLALSNGNKDEIYDLIKKTMKLNPGFKNTLRNEADFNSLHNDPAFWKLFE